MLAAALTVFPLDTFTDDPVRFMQPVDADGDAERAEIFELDGMDRRLALREARAGRGRLVRTEQRRPTPEQRRRAARAGSGSGEN